MIKRLLTSMIAVVALAFSASADTYDLLPSFGNGGWGDRTYDEATHTITYTDSWVGIGWWLESGGTYADYSAYDELVIETTESTIGYSIVIEYAAEGDNTSISVPAGRTKGVAELDPERKNAVKQIYLQNHAAGTLTLTAAYLKNAVVVDPTVPVVLFEGSKAVDWWENAIDITAGDFTAAKLAAGDKLVVEYTAEEGNGFKAIYVGDDWKGYVMPFMTVLEGYQEAYQTISLAADKSSIEFTLDQENVDICLNTKFHNVKLCGDKVTITKVSVVHATAQAEKSDWYIGGNFNGWGEYKALDTTPTEGVFTTTFDELSGEFLIVKYVDGAADWNQKICGVKNMEAGTAYPYVENSSDNFSLNGIVKNVTITLDTNAKTILVEGTTAENEYTEIYLIGDFGDGWSETMTNMPLKLKEGDTYEGTFTLTAATSYFKMKAGNFIYGTGGADVAIELGTEYTAAKSGNAFSIPAGEYTFTYVMAKNAETGKITVKNAAGITDITADDNAPVEYFNLQGVRVANPAEGGIYIRRQGAKVEKVLVK